jgi:hypothetical protein
VTDRDGFSDRRAPFCVWGYDSVQPWAADPAAWQVFFALIPLLPLTYPPNSDNLFLMVYHYTSKTYFEPEYTGTQVHRYTPYGIGSPLVNHLTLYFHTFLPLLSSITVKIRAVSGFYTGSPPSAVFQRYSSAVLPSLREPLPRAG